MTHLQGQPAEVHFTLEIKRAATGLTETVDMVGHIVLPPADLQPEAIETPEEQAP